MNRNDSVSNEEQSFSFEESQIFKWEFEKEKESINYNSVNCSHFMVAYSIKAIPEFNELQDTSAGQNYFDAILRQKTFLDGTFNVFIKKRKGLTAFLELRYKNCTKLKKIDPFLILRIVRTASYKPNLIRLVNQFEKLIPDEYEVKRLEKNAINSILKYNGESIIEIQKSINLLPVGSLYNEQSYGIPPRNMVDFDTRIKYHIPCSSYIEPKAYNIQNFFKLLQNSDETIQLRISIGAIDVFEYEKNLSIQYLNMLKLTYKSVNAPELNNYIQSYTKYIDSSHLLSLKMQVCSKFENTARAFANAFCSQIAHGEVKTVTNFHCFSINEAPVTILKNEWENCNHYFHSNPELINPFKQDSPLIENFIIRFSYISDTSEAMAVLRLPIAKAAGIPGVRSKPIKPFYQPNIDDLTEDKKITLGKVITSNKVNQELSYFLGKDDLTKHGLIVGATGSGKTNTTLNFTKELINKNIPFLIIEPVKSEYYNNLKALLEKKGTKLRRFQLSQPFTKDGKARSDFLRFNPFVSISGITPFQHLSYIKSCLMAAFPMYGILPVVLEDCLFEYLGKDLNVKTPDGDIKTHYMGLNSREYFDAKKGITHNKNIKGVDVNNKHITLKGFGKYVKEYIVKNKDHFKGNSGVDIEGSLNRRISKLTKGLLGQILCPENWCNEGNKYSKVPNNIDVLLNEPCIIELEALPDNEDKALIMAFLLTYLFESRQLRKSHDKNNQLHVTIIEEAHRLLSNTSVKSSGGGEGANMTQDSSTKTITLFIDMLAEIRSKNESIFIVEQIPSKLVSDAIKNTNLKIMHRITNKSDRDYLGEAMNMDEHQSRYATTLEVGEALVFDEKLDKPILVKMNEFK